MRAKQKENEQILLAEKYRAETKILNNQVVYTRYCQVNDWRSWDG